MASGAALNVPLILRATWGGGPRDEAPTHDEASLLPSRRSPNETKFQGLARRAGRRQGRELLTGSATQPVKDGRPPRTAAARTRGTEGAQAHLPGPSSTQITAFSPANASSGVRAGLWPTGAG